MISSDPTIVRSGVIEILGEFAEDQTIIADISGLEDKYHHMSIEYKWFADGLIIEGANSDHFILSQEEVGKLVSVEVNFTDKRSDGISFNFDDTVLPSGIDHMNLDFYPVGWAAFDDYDVSIGPPHEGKQFLSIDWTREQEVQSLDDLGDEFHYNHNIFKDVSDVNVLQIFTVLEIRLLSLSSMRSFLLMLKLASRLS